VKVTATFGHFPLPVRGHTTIGKPYRPLSLPEPWLANSRGVFLTPLITDSRLFVITLPEEYQSYD
jgi:hypothetical protein